MILDKCLADDFVELLEPGGKLGFVIPSVREHWARHFPPGLYVELCEGNVLRIRDDGQDLLTIQYQHGQVAVFSNWYWERPSADWFGVGDELAYRHFCDSWEASVQHSLRSQFRLRIPRLLRRCAGHHQGQGLNPLISEFHWQPKFPFVPVDYDHSHQMVIALTDQRVLLLLTHYQGWDDIEHTLLEAHGLQRAYQGSVSTIAAMLKQLAQQKIRLGLIPPEAKDRIQETMEQIETGVIAAGLNPRSGRWQELKDRMERYPEIRMPVYGWNSKWPDPVKLFING